MFKSHKLIQIKKKTGFTLVEVLVTLAIIGVVASLTILTLIHNSENQKTVAGVKKAYSEFSQAYASFITDDVDMDTVFAGDGQHAGSLTKFIAKMNIIKNCGTAASSGCFPDTVYTYLDGTPWRNIETYTGYGKAILADGTSIALWDGLQDCTNDRGDGPLDYVCSNIYIDVNGFKGPNQVGRDLFVIWITRTSVLPKGIYNDLQECSTQGFGCSLKVITEGAINY